MKKVFFLIAFLFTVVCYAAPPPDKLTSFLSEDVGVIRSQGYFDVQTIEVQEVAFAYIGNRSHLSLAGSNSNPVANYGFINRMQDWKVNKQNTNYGYPFGANY